jgi:hypothetical protein
LKPSDEKPSQDRRKVTRPLIITYEIMRKQ